jgi:CRP-like cAMP-binding protein
MAEYCRYARAQAHLNEGRYSDALKIAGPILEHQPGSFPAWYQVAVAAAHLKPGEAALKNLENASLALVRGLFPLQALLAFHETLLPDEIREGLMDELADRYCFTEEGEFRPPAGTFAGGEITPWNAQLTDSEVIQMAESLSALCWANSLETLQQCPGSCEMPLFSSLRPTSFIQLTHASRVRQINSGQVILPAGQQSTAIYLIIYGKAHCQLEVGLGRRVRYSHSENDLLGEESIVTGNPESADIIATEPCTLLELPVPVLLEICERESGAARFLARYYQRKILTLLLRENPLLAVLPLAERRAMLKGMTPVVSEAGSPVFPDGATICSYLNAINNPNGHKDCLFVFSGEILSSPTPDLSLNASPADNVNVFGRGDWIDLEKWCQTASARPSLQAMENTVVLKLSQNEFRAIISRYPKVTEVVHPLHEGN